jgi:diadenosine tetraphosphate (Ap4A) HIT family hydrolase
VRGELDAPGGVIYEDELWHLDHILRPIPMAGWLILKPKRHIESISAMTTAEAREFGTLASRTAAALEDATGVKKVYVGVFGEAQNFAHIHVHLIPRPIDLDDAHRGPLIFELMTRDIDLAPISEAERIAEAVRRTLASRV